MKPRNSHTDCATRRYAAHQELPASALRDDKALDAALSDAFKRDLRPGIDNPQFTRKVLNRLPEQRRSSLRWLVVALYALAVALGIYLWATIAPDFFGGRALNLRNSLQYMLTVGVFGIVTVWCFIPSRQAPQRG